MGKKIEKSLGRDKTASITAGDVGEEDPNQTPEPYVCTGNFQSDLTELCHRNNIEWIPPILLHPHRPISPTIAPVPEEKIKVSKKDDKKNQPVLEPEPEIVTDLNGEIPESPPKTYCTKEKFEYFKPSIQVEMDNTDKMETITEIYIRGWKIDPKLMTIFKQCWPRMERLHTISLWRTGLNSETLEILSDLIQECTNIRVVNLDNNPVVAECWHKLLRADSPIQHLSLRYNNITDMGAEQLGLALGTVAQQNQKLLSLNLNGNYISDTGAIALAKGLRLNRTLLSLGLAHNKIGSKGTISLAQVLSRFILTHEETVERRKLLSLTPDRKSVSPSPGSKRSNSRERPGSVRSQHGITTKGKSAKNKRDPKGGKEEEKSKTKKQDDKPQKKASIIVESTKNAAKKSHDKGKGKRGPVLPEQEHIEGYEMASPLLDMMEPLKDGSLLLKGNFNLISLNLAYNNIEQEGMKSLLAAIQYQTSISDLKGGPGNTGLMRLCLMGNKMAGSTDEMSKIAELLCTKDPCYKALVKSPDQD